MGNGDIIERLGERIPSEYRGRLVQFLNAVDDLERNIADVKGNVSQCFVRGDVDCNCIREGIDSIRMLVSSLSID